MTHEELIEAGFTYRETTTPVSYIKVLDEIKNTAIEVRKFEWDSELRFKLHTNGEVVPMYTIKYDSPRPTLQKIEPMPYRRMTVSLFEKRLHEIIFNSGKDV